MHQSIGNFPKKKFHEQKYPSVFRALEAFSNRSIYLLNNASRPTNPIIEMNLRTNNDSMYDRSTEFETSNEQSECNISDPVGKEFFERQ